MGDDDDDVIGEGEDVGGVGRLIVGVRATQVGEVQVPLWMRYLQSLFMHEAQRRRLEGVRRLTRVKRRATGLICMQGAQTPEGSYGTPHGYFVWW